MESYYVNVRLDAVTFDKIKEFTVMNNVSQSEIVRVLLEKSPLKINTRNNKTVTIEAKQTGKTNTRLFKMYLNWEGNA